LPVLKRPRNYSSWRRNSSAIKVRKTGTFDEISFYINRIQNDSIYLDLEIKLPKLNNVKFVGIKKTKLML
jgi:outer membrane protein insertion porin family